MSRICRWYPEASAERPAPIVSPGKTALTGQIGSSSYDAHIRYLIVIVEVPDHVSAAALSLAANAGGTLKAVRTTPLMTIEEGMEALRKAGGAGYRPPGS